MLNLLFLPVVTSKIRAQPINPKQTVICEEGVEEELWGHSCTVTQSQGDAHTWVNIRVGVNGLERSTDTTEDEATMSSTVVSASSRWDQGGQCATTEGRLLFLWVTQILMFTNMECYSPCCQVHTAADGFHLQRRKTDLSVWKTPGDLLNCNTPKVFFQHDSAVPCDLAWISAAPPLSWVFPSPSSHADKFHCASVCAALGLQSLSGFHAHTPHFWVVCGLSQKQADNSFEMSERLIVLIKTRILETPWDVCCRRRYPHNEWQLQQQLNREEQTAAHLWLHTWRWRSRQARRARPSHVHGSSLHTALNMTCKCWAPLTSTLSGWFSLTSKAKSS